MTEMARKPSRDGSRKDACFALEEPAGAAGLIDVTPNAFLPQRILGA
jgi:hypothetical protein